MRRSGVSLKVSDSTTSCVICRSHNQISSCFICRRQVCENCINDNDKYCLLCRDNVNYNGDTIIRVPTKTGSTNYITVKERKCCCFM
jgi:hypothetical protein